MTMNEVTFPSRDMFESMYELCVLIIRRLIDIFLIESTNYTPHSQQSAL